MDIQLPLTDEIIKKLRSGMKVTLTGILYVARDAAHKRILEALKQGKATPFPIKDATIYYMGPSPAKSGQIIGACGPTTSGRMDQYTIYLLKLGLKGTIGKGSRSKEVKVAFKQYKGVYFSAIGGAGAHIASCVKKNKLLAYPELGAESVLELEVEKFPVVVVNDIYGGDLYEEGKAKYKVKA